MSVVCPSFQRHRNCVACPVPLARGSGRRGETSVKVLRTLLMGSGKMRSFCVKKCSSFRPRSFYSCTIRCFRESHLVALVAHIPVFHRDPRKGRVWPSNPYLKEEPLIWQSSHSVFGPKHEGSKSVAGDGCFQASCSGRLDILSYTAEAPWKLRDGFRILFALTRRTRSPEEGLNALLTRPGEPG